jgi:two-component system, NarL family, nitrate/nitrite response regulator NarL
MQNSQPITVLLVDDHPFVLEGIRSCLQARSQFQIVGEAGNGREAIEKVRELKPNVVVMDISMPVMNGLEATRHLGKTNPEVKVLVLTMHEKREFTSQIIDSGARGYVSKNTSPHELVRAIETVYQGETFFSPVVTEAFLKEYLENAGKPKPIKGPELSLREREVLTLIAEGFSNKEAGGLLGVSVRTVEKHRERIMNKLGLHSVVDLTKYAIANQMVHVTSATADRPDPLP